MFSNTVNSSGGFQSEGQQGAQKIGKIRKKMQINTLFNNNLIMWSNYLLMIMYCLITLLNIIYNNISYCPPIKNFVHGILCVRFANLFIKVILLLKSAQPQRRQSHWVLRSSSTHWKKVEHPTGQSAASRVNGRSWTRSYFGRTWTQRTAFPLDECCCYLSLFNFVQGWAGQIYIKIIIKKNNKNPRKHIANRRSGVAEKNTSHHSRTAVYVIELRHQTQTEAKTNEPNSTNSDVHRQYTFALLLQTI